MANESEGWIDGPESIASSSLGSDGYHLTPHDYREPIDLDHSFVQSAHTEFDMAKYDGTHSPLVIGEVNDREHFSMVKPWPKGVSITNHPIKVPGNTGYFIPRAMYQFFETISKIVSFEHSVNQFANEYYAYLTVCQSVVEATRFQRTYGTCFVEGAHHGMNRNPVVRSYTVSDRVPDIFYRQSYNLERLFGDTVMLQTWVSMQSNDANALKYGRYNIVASNVYTPCRETTMDCQFYRTFMKVTYDTVKRHKGSANPMLDAVMS